jgi:hypothetical protein
MPARTATAEVTVDHAALVAALGDIEVKRHQPNAGRAIIGKVTTAYFQETKSGIRFRLVGEVPKTLLAGLKTKPGKKGTTVYVETVPQARKVAAALERIAKDKTK